MDAEDIPRCTRLNGSTLRIVGTPPGNLREIIITDGERTAVYVPSEDAPDELRGPTLRIEPDYTEAGWFAEANQVLISDGVRKVHYVPAETLRAPAVRPIPFHLTRF